MAPSSIASLASPAHSPSHTVVNMPVDTGHAEFTAAETPSQSRAAPVAEQMTDTPSTDNKFISGLKSLTKPSTNIVIPASAALLSAILGGIADKNTGAAIGGILGLEAGTIAKSAMNQFDTDSAAPADGAAEKTFLKRQLHNISQPSTDLAASVAIAFIGSALGAIADNTNGAAIGGTVGLLVGAAGKMAVNHFGKDN